VSRDNRVFVNPFPGLRPFEPDEEHLFFGRETQVDDLLSRLAQKRFVAVVGASGSGKSSLVRAGLLPALHGGFMAAGSHWHVAIMHPGRTPIASLARAIDASGVLGARRGDALLRVGLVQAILERGALGLIEVVREARLGSNESLLVVVDQFEELVRFKAEDAVAFVRLLVAAVSQTTQPIYVVITMRSDFLGDVSHFRQLPELISEALFLVPRLTRAQFARAIEGPARVAGGIITPRLTNRLLNDLEDDANQLPVLQHALMRTWDAHTAGPSADGPLDVEDLEAIGALSESLSRHGDEVNDSLRTDRLRYVAEKMFKCLTDLGDDNRGVRRPTRFADLCAIADAPPDEVREVADAFRAPDCSFLTPPSPQPIESETVLDIAHESLMRLWTRLQRWVEEESQSAQIYRRLAAAAALYRQGRAALWRDPDLAIAVNWRVQNRPIAAWGDRLAPGFDSAMQFLDESLAERARERRQRAALVRATLAALAVVAVMLLGLSLVAFAQWRVADASLRIERAERLADLSLQESTNPRAAAALAADAYAMVKTPRTAGAMLEQLLKLHVLRSVATSSIMRAAFAKHGALLGIVTQSAAGPRLTVLDAANFSLRGRVAVTGIKEVLSLCGSSSGGTFALSDGRHVVIYDGVRGAQLPISALTAARSTLMCLRNPHNGALPAYDPETQVYATYGNGMLEERAREGIVAPALGEEPAPVWPGSFASIGSLLVLAGAHAVRVEDLNQYRSTRANAPDVGRTVRISDPGDGVHAVALDYQTGVVRIFAFAPAPQVVDEFRAHAAPSLSGAFTNRPEIAYDPAGETTEAWVDGITQFTPGGGTADQARWETLATAAGLPSWYPGLTYLLSARGAYVGLTPPSDLAPQEGRRSPAASAVVAIVSSRGGPIASFVATPFISTDERFLIGLSTTDNDTAWGLYRLPRADRVRAIDLPPTSMAAFSRDDGIVAYATRTAAARDTDIQFFDLAANSPIGPPLPPPAGAAFVTNLAFSDDDRFLIASYRMAGAPDELVVYAASPAEWQRSLCLWAGAQRIRASQIASEHGILPPDACRKYASAI
jgi:energy-coupling factor transporter ATP-binding protein EcfA2